MQRRKTLWAAALLMAVLTLFVSVLPLCAAGNSAPNNTAGGMLENAADAVRGAAEGLLGGNMAVDGRRSADTTGDNAKNGNFPAAGNDMAGGRDRTPAGDELLPGETAGDGATLGDVNGDGVTDDRAPDTTTGTDTGTAADTMTNGGFSWGGILLALLAAVAVIVVAVMLIPRRRSN